MLREVRKIAADIKTMRVRGAGKIAREAARALAIVAELSKAKTSEEFVKEISEASKILLSTRPTAVSLSNAIQFVMRGLRADEDLSALRATVKNRAEEFIKSSLEAVKRIGEIGAKRLQDGDVVLTHCNSQAALSVIITAFKQGKKIEAFVTESRPRLQGRLSARQLLAAGVPTTMIVDSAVRFIMKEVDKVIVGADSIASNGAVVNKIGTSQIALAAHESRVLFFVAAETYKFHPRTLIGELIEIEERDPSEVIDVKKFPGLKVRNPAFDVTPSEYVDLIITERGIIPPSAAYSVMKEVFGWELFESSGGI